MKRSILRILAVSVFMFCMTLCISQTGLAATKAPRLNLKKLDLTKGTTFTIRVYNLSEGDTAVFKSTDTDVLKIHSVADNKRSAVIYGKTVGKATLKVNIKRSGKVIDTLKCKVKVAPIPVSIKFSDNSITLLEGRQAYIDVIIKPYSATETPVFESSNEDVAVVNVHGLVTAVAPGKATITATLLSTGKTATCTVVVKEDPDDD